MNVGVQSYGPLGSGRPIHPEGGLPSKRKESPGGPHLPLPQGGCVGWSIRFQGPQLSRGGIGVLASFAVSGVTFPTLNKGIYCFGSMNH